MKFFGLLFCFLIFGFNAICSTEIGCKTGNFLYPNPTGGSYTNGPVYPLYDGSKAYQLLSTGDVGCGVPRNNSYPSAPIPSGYTTTKCAQDGNPGDVGQLVYYETSTIEGCSLDNNGWVAFLFISVVGLLVVKKSVTSKPDVQMDA